MEHTNKKQITYLLKHINKNLKMIPTAEEFLDGIVGKVLSNRYSLCYDRIC